MVKVRSPELAARPSRPPGARCSGRGAGSGDPAALDLRCAPGFLLVTGAAAAAAYQTAFFAAAARAGVAVGTVAP